MPLCSFFAQKGTCRYGDQCRFQHVASAQVNKAKNKCRKRRSGPITSSTNHIAEFFAKYSSYHYDPLASFMDEFHAMCDQFGWNNDDNDDNDEKMKKARRGLQDAMVLQFNDVYGTSVNDLQAWQSLCRALGIDSVPDDLKECRAVVMHTHVNIGDLVDAPTMGKPQIFDTVEALANYTRDNEKIFPRSNVHAGSLLRFLLRHIL